MKNKQTRPLLILIVAPSGAGKTTLCDMLLEEFPEIVYSISCTTRLPRKSEVDGEDYFFISEEQFIEKVNNDMFLEHAVVHGQMYGTLKSTVEESMREGLSVLMDIDVQGAARIRDALDQSSDSSIVRSGLVDIFINPPSLAELKNRLTLRGDDSEEEIDRRVAVAAEEMACSPCFRYVIVNKDLNHTYAELKEIILENMKQLVG